MASFSPACSLRPGRHLGRYIYNIASEFIHDVYTSAFLVWTKVMLGICT